MGRQNQILLTQSQEKVGMKYPNQNQISSNQCWHFSEDTTDKFKSATILLARKVTRIEKRTFGKDKTRHQGGWELCEKARGIETWEKGVLECGGHLEHDGAGDHGGGYAEQTQYKYSWGVASNKWWRYRLSTPKLCSRDMKNVTPREGTHHYFVIKSLCRVDLITLFYQEIANTYYKNSIWK